MKITLVCAAAACFALAGCIDHPITGPIHAAQDDAKCQSYGAKPGSDSYVNCRVAMEQEHGRLRRALFGASASLLAAGSAPPPRPITCTGTRMGTMTTASCY